MPHASSNDNYRPAAPPELAFSRSSVIAPQVTVRNTVRSQGLVDCALCNSVTLPAKSTNCHSCERNCQWIKKSKYRVQCLECCYQLLAEFGEALLRLHELQKKRQEA